ncbi:HNH endonuclease [Pseudobutyrivibrio ruminis]|uniref:HNH endonuclease n=1 Tax=Pseudobutyrivibrio ruminis TaxID=46206 RepID=UPI00051ACC12|nr:HNH endonuclease [Pseudobutyrivibrio ruminis]
MHEIKSSDVPINELTSKVPENFRNIQPDNGMTVEDARSFWDNELKDLDNQETSDAGEFGGKYKSYEDRLSCVPVSETKGQWEGQRGESKFVPSDDVGKECKDKLAEYKLDGIEYKNLEPDFSKCSEATVQIEDMDEHRWDYIDANGDEQLGNFSKADEKAAQLWNEQNRDGRTDWTAEDVYDYRNNLEHHFTWHERCDTKTMDLVPYEIHNYCTHSGGVAECKARDAVNAGGEFDE